MKITQESEKIVFRPITITLERLSEATSLHDALNNLPVVHAMNEMNDRLGAIISHYD